MVRRSLVLLSVLAVAGCGTPPPRHEAAPAFALLSHIRANESTLAYVEYADLTKVRKLDPERLRRVDGVGYADLARTRIKLQELLAVDVARFDEAVTLGQPPTKLTYLRGYPDATALTEKLAAVGAEKTETERHTQWRTAADNEMRFDGPFSEIRPPNALNVIRLDANGVGFAAAAPTLDWLGATEGSLAQHESVIALIGCLDTAAVVIMQPKAANRTTLAVGVRIDGPADTTDVVCIRGKDAADASELRKQFEATFKGAKTRSGTPWSQVLPNPTFDVVGDTVRISAKTDNPGLVFAALAKGDIDGLADFE